MSRQLVAQESALVAFPKITTTDDLDSSGWSDASQGEGKSVAPSLPLRPLRVDEVGGQDRPAAALPAWVVERRPLAPLMEGLDRRTCESMRNQNIEALRSRPVEEHTRGPLRARNVGHRHLRGRQRLPSSQGGPGSLVRFGCPFTSRARRQVPQKIDGFYLRVPANGPELGADPCHRVLRADRPRAQLHWTTTLKRWM